MSAYVFLGPTLPVREARRYLDAEYLPPVAQGDVLRVLDKRPSVIAIVDGFFELVPSVWHKEILLALESGVHVFGAASMGALRAAELHAYGMKGVGRIYRWYASGRLEDDDEVAVVHGPADQGYREMSDAMVNVRDRCLSAARRGVVSRQVAGEIVGIAKAMFYPERRWPRILADARAAGVAERDISRMAAYLKTEKQPPLKARDATELLRRVASVVKRRPRPFRARTRTERTKYIGRLLAEVAAPAAGATRTTQHGRAEELALLRILMAREALHAGHQVNDADVAAVEDALRRDLGLLNAADTDLWLARCGLSPDDFDAWMRDEALATRLRARFGNAVTRQARTEGQRLSARSRAAITEPSSR
ncbi:MAG TPA: TfuA-like protein [Vicinamibacterales bacterium]|nr:TfuA-like protein [Vicinamibacterales bacterium]